MTGDTGKEHGTNKPHQPEEFEKGQKETRDASLYVLVESSPLESTLTEQGMRHLEGPWVRMIGQKKSRELIPSP